MVPQGRREHSIRGPVRPATVGEAGHAGERCEAHQLRDLGEEPGHELAALAEPLAEQAVRVDIYELAVRKPAHAARCGSAQAPQQVAQLKRRWGVPPVAEAHGELLGKGLAERGLAGAGRPVQQHCPIEGHQMAVHSPLPEQQRLRTGHTPHDLPEHTI